GCKADSRENNETNDLVSKEKGLEVADQIRAQYFETSSKTGTGIENLVKVLENTKKYIHKNDPKKTSNKKCSIL
ncbi:hypothetical protein HK098_004899, partial [Nowakowskiella sp. JEL0407]